MFGRNPDAEAILKIKGYCDLLFEAGLPEVDLKAFMNDAEMVRQPNFAALRIILGLYILDLMGNIHLILPLDDQSAIGGLNFLYSDQFGLVGDAAEALREPALVLKNVALEKIEAGGKSAELEKWPDQAALAVVMLAGKSAERICEEYRKNPKSGMMPTDEEVGDFAVICGKVMETAAETEDAADE
jgi:hypothetical protein